MLSHTQRGPLQNLFTPHHLTKPQGSGHILEEGPQSRLSPSIGRRALKGCSWIGLGLCPPTWNQHKINQLRIPAWRGGAPSLGQQLLAVDCCWGKGELVFFGMWPLEAVSDPVDDPKPLSIWPARTALNGKINERMIK